MRVLTILVPRGPSPTSSVSKDWPDQPLNRAAYVAPVRSRRQGGHQPHIEGRVENRLKGREARPDIPGFGGLHRVEQSRMEYFDRRARGGRSPRRGGRNVTLGGRL